MGTKIRLLIVDDFAADVLIYYTYILQAKIGGIENIECEIFTAETGEDGLEAYFNKSPDCVLLDYSLPDMTGLEFIESIYETQETLIAPIVLATGYEDPGIQDQAKELGISGYYIKGRDSAQTLVNILTSALAQQKPELFKTGTPAQNEFSPAVAELM